MARKNLISINIVMFYITFFNKCINDKTYFIGAMPEISKTSRVNNMNCKFTNSFITLLYVYDCLMPVNSRKKRYEELQEFLEGRVVRHKEYFRTNTKIVGVYKFQEKVIKNLLTNT